MNREQKVELSTLVKKELLASDLVILLHYRGLKDSQLYDFRHNLKDKDIKLKVVKNTLARIAVKGTALDVLTPYLNGPVAIAYAGDSASLAKITVDAIKKYKLLKIQTGYLNENLISEDVINRLSKLGSLEEVRASFVGKLKAVQTSFVRTLNAPATGIVALLNNYASSKG